MTRTGYQAYQMYLALQRHFSSSYDYFKYQGKVNASVDAYNKRNDFYSFEKLGKIVPQKEWMMFFVAHFLDKPNCWIKDMSKADYETYKTKLKNFPKQFQEEIEYIASQYSPPDLVVVEDDFTIPLLHDLCIKKKISIETIILIDMFYSFIDNHEKVIKVPMLWPQHILKLKKYRPFVKKFLNIEYYNDIALEAFKRHKT